MNEIIRKVVRVADLPKGMREGFDPAANVEIEGPGDDTSRRSAADVLDDVARLRREGVIKPRFGSSEEVVAYVRALRDGGDLDRWLAPCSTSTPTS